MAYTDIDDPSAYFQTKLYTEAGAYTFDGNSDMQPDFVWIKERNGTNEHNLFDSVRGTTKRLESSTNAAEQTSSTTLTAFGSDGFTVGNNPGTGQNGGNYVGWGWKKSATPGFDIVAFTGNGSARTISHSLSAVPKMYIVKNRSTGSTQWRVYHASLGATKHMALDATQAVGDAASVFNDTEPTSSVFSVGTDDAANKNGDSLIAYLFADKQGYSKFGSYIGNGNVNGSYIHLGFKPAFVLIKRAIGDAGEGWSIFDNARSPFNKMLNELRADVASAESTSNHTMEFYSNGFKIPRAGGGINTSGDTHIYMAFAEQPFVTSTGVPATAR